MDVGIVEHPEMRDGKRVLSRYEVDFVCNKGSQRYFFQSAFAIPTEEKMTQEQRRLLLTGDFFKIIFVTRDSAKPWHNENSVLILNIQDELLLFLLPEVQACVARSRIGKVVFEQRTDVFLVSP